MIKPQVTITIACSGQSTAANARHYVSKNEGGNMAAIEWVCLECGNRIWECASADTEFCWLCQAKMIPVPFDPNEIELEIEI